jgi:acetamidase/formamidase
MQNKMRLWSIKASVLEYRKCDGVEFKAQPYLGYSPR